MIANSEVMFKGRAIDVVDDLVRRYGGMVAGWRHVKSFDEWGRVVRWFEHDGLPRVDVQFKWPQ